MKISHSLLQPIQKFGGIKGLCETARLFKVDHLIIFPEKGLDTKIVQCNKIS